MTIGVFFGGKSPEHDVSIITGQLVLSELKKMGRPVVPVYIDKSGTWHIDESLGELKFFQREDKETALKNLPKYQIDLEKSQRKLVLKKIGLLSKELTIDMAFPAFHGSYGEDGTIQGLFEMFDVPYVGCDVPSSAITFDKVLTKQVYVSNNIPTAEFVRFNKNDWNNFKDRVLSDIKAKISFPMMVKPPTLGSSIGISKAKNEQELEFAIEVALHYGQNVLVEQCIEQLMDVTCCVIGNDELEASLLQESVFSSDLFNFEEKYLKDGGAQLGNAESSLVIPASLDEQTTLEIRELAKKVYKLVGCSGIARVDFLYDKAAKIYYANEINPMPGTVYHHLWKASCLELNRLLEKLINYAQERQAQKASVQYTFESELLKSAHSIKLQMKNKS